MIITYLSIPLFILFAALGGIHIYWLFGGHWALDKVIPTKENRKFTKPIAIPKFATLLVAIGLMLCGAVYLSTSKLVTFPFPSWIVDNGILYIPIVFTLRAIGEFKYVGFFKKVKNTEFAKMDTTLFSPLCIGIGIIGGLVFWLSS
ncbi:DUF3995 domain-containing protein [Reichenbachiella versicolor]|uniref:DUF3995 domain-containing protein n=1 Tax=Reichenbachiella versicolor TaxID=1821036 RepID=UPI000D6DD54B|nr:DUF3995 domain-containing protein [Reichenbachiella versicolor]